MSAQVHILTDGAAIIRFEFSYSVVEELKARIPAYARSYDAGSKAWTVISGPFVDVAIDVLEDCFRASNVYIADDRTRVSRASSSTDPYAALHLLPSAPPELVKAAYKTLARLNHPDTGGDTTAMQQINAAAATLHSRGIG